MIRSAALFFLGASALFAGVMCVMWGLTGQVPDHLDQVYPIAAEARALKGVARDYYMYANMATGHGQLFTGIVTLLIMAFGNNTSKAVVCLAYLLMGGISLYLSQFMSQGWMPAQFVQTHFYKTVIDISLAVIGILFGGSGSQRQKAKTN